MYGRHEDVVPSEKLSTPSLPTVSPVLQLFKLQGESLGMCYGSSGAAEASRSAGRSSFGGGPRARRSSAWHMAIPSLQEVSSSRWSEKGPEKRKVNTARRSSVTNMARHEQLRRQSFVQLDEEVASLRKLVRPSARST